MVKLMDKNQTRRLTFEEIEEKIQYYRNQLTQLGYDEDEELEQLLLEVKKEMIEENDKAFPS